jgi:hypothetical protein
MEAAFARKLFASNANAVFMILDKYLKPAPDEFWHLLYDEQLEPYWYSYYSKSRIRTTLAEIDACPKVPLETEAEMQEITVKRVMQRALFEIPERVKLRFSPVLIT